MMNEPEWVEVVDCKGERHRAAKVGPARFAELRARLRQRRMEEVYDLAIRKSATPMARADMMSGLGIVAVTEQDVLHELSTTEGTFELLAICLQRFDGNMAVERVKELFGDHEVLRRATDAIYGELSGGKAEDDASPPTNG